MLIVLSSPSGGGKSTLAKMLIESDKSLILSVSVTSRKARNCERDSVDYFFKTDQEFQQMIANEELLEYAKIYDHWYGTDKHYISSKMLEGYNILLDINYQGLLQIKNSIYRNNILSIFILPPSLSVLQNRIRSRMQDNPSVIDLRMQSALSEMNNAQYYDYIVTNDNLMITFDKIKNIISSHIKTSES
ncbi:guanylate kinase [Rickettsia endosymbiont of Cardiosporidium cionae]|uniref:guanylate kinase n=1 Tax=Rickettsia endosymbiont of Cardiosporidium cionae TaxID=2777155 RepID=UPI00189409F4|nr:guanylate kinase [Rickettsia endosymbiont of Cardiosporidium cionae]KAF8818398.1 guanylate kinase [Rickettsia endosymbiont of Cardiosporidium cionae]